MPLDRAATLRQKQRMSKTGGFAIAVAFVMVSSAWAHKGHEHGHAHAAPPAAAASAPASASAPAAPTGKAAGIPAAALARINQGYAKLKPLAQQKCLNCHGTSPVLPWYYKVPGVQQLMNADMAEAREHLDMSGDFPFGGHGSPREDLEEIKKDVVTDDMPPWYYKPLHPEARMSDADKKAFADWVDDSLKALGDSAK